MDVATIKWHHSLVLTCAFWSFSNLSCWFYLVTPLWRCGLLSYCLTAMRSQVRLHHLSVLGLHRQEHPASSCGSWGRLQPPPHGPDKDKQKRMEGGCLIDCVKEGQRFLVAKMEPMQKCLELMLWWARRQFHSQTHPCPSQLFFFCLFVLLLWDGNGEINLEASKRVKISETNG